MSSIIKVNTFQDTNGNALFNSDGSGNVTLSAGAMKNTPSFFASLSSNQTISDNSLTLGAFATEIFDTGDYDNSSSNYKFTPSVAGKYYFYGRAWITIPSGTDARMVIYKNGSAAYYSSNVTGGARDLTVVMAHTAIANGSSDYFQCYLYQNSGNGTDTFEYLADGGKTCWGAYRLIGA